MNYLKSKQKTLNKSNVCFSIFNDAFEQEFAHTKQTFTYSKKLWNMFKVNNKETTRRLKTPERRHLVVPVSSFLTSNKFHTFL